MTRQAPRDDEDGVDADRVAGLGIARGQALGGGRDAAQTIFVERQGRGILAGALLDLDEGEGMAAPRNQVDLAARDPRAPRENMPAVQPEPPCRDRLGAAPPRFGRLAGQSLVPSSSARA